MVKVILWALVIFICRAVDVALGTLRVRMVVNRRKYLAATIGFFEVLLYILIVSKVIQNTGNIFNVIAYCAGFSCGTILGLSLEERWSKDMVKATILVKGNSFSLFKLIKEAEFEADLVVVKEELNSRMDMINIILTEERKKELEEIIDNIRYDSLISFQALDKVRCDFFYSLKSKI